MDVRLTAIGLTEQQLAVTLCVTNPNQSELSFSQIATALDVAGSPLANGLSDVPVHLPPLASAAVPFTVVTTVRNLGPQLGAIFRSGQVDYRLHGSVSLQGGLALTIPYSRSGRLDLLASGLGMALSPTEAQPSRCAAPA